MAQSGDQVVFHVPSGSWKCDANSFKKHNVNGRISMDYAEQRSHVETYCENNGCGSYYYFSNNQYNCDDGTFKH